MKLFFRTLFLEMNINKEKIRLLYKFISGLILIFTFCTYVGLLFQFSTSRSILQSYDDDSSYGIETAIKSNWINHNSSTTYGPLYYRISTPIRYILTHSYLSEGLSSSEKIEKSVHFHLLIINLIALFFTSYLLLNLITKDKIWLYSGTAILSSLFLTNEYRSLLLFMAKPDLLLSCFVIIAVLITIKWMSSPSESNLRKLALTWALASLTKLITIFFAPSIVIILWLSDRKNLFSNIKFFLKWIIVFYFFIGFPQSLDLWGYLKYLLQQNSHTSFVSWSFLTSEWFPLFYNDLYRPLLFIFAFSLLVPLRKQESLTEKQTGLLNLLACGNIHLHTKFMLQLLLFVGLAFIAVMSKQTRDPFRWYTFSFTNAALILWSLGLLYLYNKLNSKITDLMNAFKNSLWTPLGIFLFFPLTGNIFPTQPESNYKQGMSCRSEAMEVKQLLDLHAVRGKHILTDPYVPYNLDFHNHQITATWEMHLDLLKDEKWKLIGLNNQYYGRYLIENNSSVTYMKDLTPAAQFYKLFANQNNVTDPWGHQWIQTHKDRCGFEVWEKK